jgi:hypothetical protein
MFTFQEKRELQRIIDQLDKVLADAPSFTTKRTAQRIKINALNKLDCFPFRAGVTTVKHKKNPISKKPIGYSFYCLFVPVGTNSIFYKN